MERNISNLSLFISEAPEAHLVPVILLEGGLHLGLTHPPAGPDGGGHHLSLANVAVRVNVQGLVIMRHRCGIGWMGEILFFVFVVLPQMQFLFLFFYRKIHRS